MVVFSNDAHQPSDPELRVWGEHAMAGTPGAEVIAELAPAGEREFVSPKRSYGAFDGTGLDERLQRPRGRRGCDRGAAHAHLRPPLLVRRADPRLRDHRPSRRCLRFEGVDEQEALNYLHSVYGACDHDGRPAHRWSCGCALRRGTLDVPPDHIGPRRLPVLLARVGVGDAEDRLFAYERPLADTEAERRRSRAARRSLVGTPDDQREGASLASSIPLSGRVPKLTAGAA